MKRVLPLFLLCALILCAMCSCALFEKIDAPQEDAERPYNYDLSEYITLAPYKGLSVSLSEIEPDEEQIQSQIESDFAPLRCLYERGVEWGDRVNLNYIASYEGSDYEDGTENGFFLTIGENELNIPGFDEGLIGITPGDSTALDLTFPENYEQNPDYAGKTVSFTITVNYIYVDLPELTDEIVSTCTSYATKDEYLAGIRDSLTKANKVTLLWKQVMDNTIILQYPEKEYRIYYEDFKKSYELLAENYSMSLSDYLSFIGETEESFDKRANEETQNYLKEDLIVHAIAKAENLTVSDEEYEQGKQSYYDKVVFDYFLTPELMEESLGKAYLVEHILANKVLDLICESAVECA